MGCHIQHNQIYHKYDQCRTKVFRYHQDQHVKSSYDRRHYEIFKFRRTLKTGCYKEHKYDLHQLRGLEGNRAYGNPVLGAEDALPKQYVEGQQR